MRDPSHLWDSIDGVYKCLHWCFVPRIATISKMIETMVPLKSVVPGLQLKDKLVTVKDIQDLLTNTENDLSVSSRGAQTCTFH